MSESNLPSNATLEAKPAEPVKAAEMPTRILIVPYPKVVFLYPVLVMAVVAGIYMSFRSAPLDPANHRAALVATAFLMVLGLNLVVLAFDFPRTTSLTLFFLAVALVFGGALLFTLKPGVLPLVTGLLDRFRPLANATFYWTIAAVLATLLVAVMLAARFDYWEVRPNELLHHHGFLANLERLSAPNLRIDSEINDVFEYCLLRSGRLILHFSEERRLIILDNVPFIKQKEDAITRMLGALQVEVRRDTASS